MFIRLEDATSLQFGESGPRVDSPEAYLAWQAWNLRRSQSAVRSNAPPGAVARVEHGRWLIDCGCGASVFTHPAWRLACCAHCGAVHRDVVVPPSPVADGIAALLLKRVARAQQNWYPSETLDDLHAENAAHGVEA